MALRIEYILFIFLMILLGSLILPDKSSVRAIESNGSTELLFKDFTLIELGEKGVENQLSASLAIKDRRYFKLEDINVTYKKSHHLFAKNALYQDKFIYLNSNVWVKRDDGLSFRSNQLLYSLSQGTIKTQKPFFIEMNESKIEGTNLQYDLNIKRITADRIKAKIIFER